MTHYLPFSQVMQGELTYDQALDVTIGQSQGYTSVQRLEKLIHLYIPALRDTLVDSGRWRSGFRNDVDQDYEVMPITIPTRCRSQIATASEW